MTTKYLSPDWYNLSIGKSGNHWQKVGPVQVCIDNVEGWAVGVDEKRYELGHAQFGFISSFGIQLHGDGEWDGKPAHVTWWLGYLREEE